jgi:hypothetical protein
MALAFEVGSVPTLPASSSTFTTCASAAMTSWTSSVTGPAISTFGFWLTEKPLTMTRTR